MLLEEVFRIINESGLDYCVQNKYELMPEIIPSDIDMMYRNATETDLDRIVIKIAEETGLIITQKIVQDYGEYTYIISYPSPLERFQLQLDFYRVISKGRIHNALTAGELLDNKRFYKIFYVPGEYEELRYIFVRRTLKKDLKIDDLIKAEKLFKDKQFDLEIDFGKNAADLIVKLIKEKDISIFYDNYCVFMDAIVAMSQKNYKYKQRLDYIFFKLRNYPTKRIIHKCGMSIAFLAPDGTGKSTLINRITETCSGSFYGVYNLYFRPRLFKNLGSYNIYNPTSESNENNDPHSKELNSKVKSAVRFIFYNFDFLLGNMIVVNNKKIRKKLVVFDRYYYDYYADMERYQYSINKKWVSFFQFMIPEPDIVFILDAPAEVIRSRKQELSLIEIEEQRQAFLCASKRIHNAVIVDANRDIDDITQEVTSIILNKQFQKTKKIMVKD